MTKYLAGVLTVIAAGVLLVAYGLLSPRAAVDGAAVMSPLAQPAAFGEPVRNMAPPMTYAPAAAYVPAGYTVPVAQAPAYAPVPVTYAQPIAEQAPRPVRTVSYEPPARPRATSVRYVERAPRRDWKKTALIIGGSSATGAGVGAIFGGKKGALIGAAIAGGASTIYQTMK